MLFLYKFALNNVNNNTPLYLVKERMSETKSQDEGCFNKKNKRVLI